MELNQYGWSFDASFPCAFFTVKIGFFFMTPQRDKWPSSPQVMRCSSLISLTESIDVWGPLNTSWDSSTILKTRTDPSRPPEVAHRSRTPESMPEILSWWPKLKRGGNKWMDGRTRYKLRQQQQDIKIRGIKQTILTVFLHKSFRLDSIFSPFCRRSNYIEYEFFFWMPNRTLNPGARGMFWWGPKCLGSKCGWDLKNHRRPETQTKTNKKNSSTNHAIVFSSPRTFRRWPWPWRWWRSSVPCVCLPSFSFLPGFVPISRHWEWPTLWSQRLWSR